MSDEILGDVAKILAGGGTPVAILWAWLRSVLAERKDLQDRLAATHERCETRIEALHAEQKQLLTEFRDELRKGAP